MIIEDVPSLADQGCVPHLTFKVTEHANFELRGEFFNALNTPDFGGPGTTPGSTSYGYVTLTQVNDPRLTQLTVRINF